MMATTAGKVVKTKDTAGNAVLVNPGDHGQDALGNWWVKHPNSGLSVQLKVSEPVIVNANGTITVTQPVTLIDVEGVKWTGQIINSVFIN